MKQYRINSHHVGKNTTVTTIEEREVPAKKRWMEVSFDGGVTWEDAPEGVRVVYRQVMDDDGTLMDMLVNCTHEGLIVDATNPEGEVARTNSFAINEMWEWLS